jgi:multiple sugar transport system ATP-binding protein
MPRSRTASTAARTLRIEHLLDRKTDKLSGGEMQRVSIGRAIVRKPRVFLMDEPLSALDVKLREALRTELKNLQIQLGATFLFVTHDQIEAMSMGDKVGVLNHGRIVQTGTPYEIYNNPRDTYVASFVGSPPMNLIDGKLVNGCAVMAPLNFELPFSGGAKASAATDGRPLVTRCCAPPCRPGPMWPSSSRCALPGTPTRWCCSKRAAASICATRHRPRPRLFRQVGIIS